MLQVGGGKGSGGISGGEGGGGGEGGRGPDTTEAGVWDETDWDEGVWGP
jgi:hypothetical protein